MSVVYILMRCTEGCADVVAVCTTMERAQEEANKEERKLVEARNRGRRFWAEVLHREAVLLNAVPLEWERNGHDAEASVYACSVVDGETWEIERYEVLA